MEQQDVTREELLRLVKGMPVCIGLFWVGTALLGRFSLSMVLGTALGTAWSLLSFHLLGQAVEVALQKEPAAARRYMSSQYFMRLALTAFVIIVSFQVDVINPVGVIVPLFFPKIIIHTRSIFEKGGENR